SNKLSAARVSCGRAKALCPGESSRDAGRFFRLCSGGGLLDHIFDPRTERDACGIGFIANADGSSARSVVEAALEALFRVRHRGALASDALTGDGAGVLTPIPQGLFGPRGVAMVFARSDSYHAAV